MLTRTSTSSTGDPLKPLQDPTSRSDLVAESIRKAVLAGQLPPGTPLVERDIAARMGVSKTPVREALISLSRTGLVAINRHRGISVATISEDDIRSIYRVRVLLEPDAVASGVPFFVESAVVKAKALLDQADDASSRKDWVSLSLTNRRFHRLVYSRCPNQLQVSILDNLQDRVALMGVENWREEPTWRTENVEHAEILEAISQGDAALAAELTERHISEFVHLRNRLRDSNE